MTVHKTNPLPHQVEATVRLALGEARLPWLTFVPGPVISITRTGRDCSTGKRRPAVAGLPSAALARHWWYSPESGIRFR